MQKPKSLYTLPREQATRYLETDQEHSSNISAFVGLAFFNYKFSAKQL